MVEAIRRSLWGLPGLILLLVSPGAPQAHDTASSRGALRSAPVCSATTPRAVSCRRASRAPADAGSAAVPSSGGARPRARQTPGAAYLRQLPAHARARWPAGYFASPLFEVPGSDCRWLGPNRFTCRPLRAPPKADPFVDALLVEPDAATRRVLDPLGIPAVPNVPPIVVINPDKKSRSP